MVCLLCNGDEDSTAERLYEYNDSSTFCHLLSGQDSLNCDERLLESLVHNDQLLVEIVHDIRKMK